jgi:hypothetical protein
MVSAAQGTTVTVGASYTDGVGGPPIDVSGLEITIGGGAGIGPTSAGIVHPATGQYTYSWAIPADQTPGNYPVSWTSDQPEVDDVIAVVATVASVGMTWATVADVANLTGKVVTVQTLMMAQGVIDLHSETTTNARINIRPRDKWRLMQAVAYQAAWLSSAPDAFTRNEISSAGHAATSFSFVDAESVTLAPLAKRALSKLSWKRSRSVRIRMQRRGGLSLRQRWYDMEHDTGDYESSAYWTPM